MLFAILGLSVPAFLPTTADAPGSVLQVGEDAFPPRATPSSSNVLLFSTYLGGTHTEDTWDVSTDRDGFVYVVGNTLADDFPVTPGAYATTRAGYIDAFVAKLTPDGSDLVFATYLGGSDLDDARSVAVDGSGSVYVAGTTASADFPMSAGAYDSDFGGGFRDAFIAILSSDGSQLLYSTYLGGQEEEQVAYLAVDDVGAIYLATTTWSTDFPSTAGGWDPSPNGNSDVTVTKLSRGPTITSLDFSTFVGGANSDAVNGLHLDPTGVYLVGTTLSEDFPTTAAAYDGTFNGGFSDAFVAALDLNGASMLYSSYLGGSDIEQGRAIEHEMGGRMIVAGRTSSPDFPKTPGAFDSETRGQEDAFVTVLESGGAGLHVSTVLGGSRLEEPWSVAIDADGFVYLTGGTLSDDFPTTQAAFEPVFNGQLGFTGDAFLLKMDPSGSALVYSTYFGGAGAEWGISLDLAPDDSIVIAGYVYSADFPVTPGAFDTTPAYADAFVARFNLTGFTNATPSLDWVGTGNFTSRGVDPVNGSEDQTFTYRISYRDLEGDLPSAGYPRVHILWPAGFPYQEINGSPFALVEVNPQDTVVSDGKDYEFTTRLSGSANPTTYGYFFSAIDSSGSAANDYPPWGRGPATGPTVWPIPNGPAEPPDSALVPSMNLWVLLSVPAGATIGAGLYIAAVRLRRKRIP